MQRSRFMATTLLVGVLLLGAAPSAFASPPDNDDFANADVVAGLPFTDSGDLAGLTVEPGEPSSACLPFSVSTAWYVFTPTTSGPVRIDPAGSSFDVSIVAYQSFFGGFDGLSFLGCGGGFGNTPMVLPVTAGSTYYVQVGQFPGSGLYQLLIEPVAPPANDNFADAATLSGLPVSATVNVTGATIEPGEPASPSGIRTSVWYSFTPETSGSLFVRPNPDPALVLAVYTGESLDGLTVVASGSGHFPNVQFAAQAGTTYHVQVAKSVVMPTFSPIVTISIEEPSPPVALIFSMPSDPSVNEYVSFLDMSIDPMFIGFGSAQWDFGDGATATGCCVNHRYAADGDYTVTMIATTLDGRTATATRVVAVRTHDVSIERIQAPNTAQVGQTKNVRVNVRGGAYPETVQVDLFRSTAGGFEQFVGTQTLPVPAARGGRTTSFDFRHTFTPDDGATGKVTFRAVATIVGGRDALPADNQAIAPPTKVTG